MNDISKDDKFMNIFAKIKSKDPAIYDKDTLWYNETSESKKSGKIKEKSYGMKEYLKDSMHKSESISHDEIDKKQYYDILKSSVSDPNMDLEEMKNIKEEFDKYGCEFDSDLIVEKS